mmetsp:Transcript_1107/g.2657  ORF Transcript_1107/g.2657 Transcript_1107/m.2657 type:complete len:209 (-) Transcript_1107:386-1012(-)
MASAGCHTPLRASSTGRGGAALPIRSMSRCSSRSFRNPSRKTSPALYEERTSGPLATYLKPIAMPSRCHSSYSAGGTIRTTGMCRLLGRRYWPRVKISTPRSSMSRITCRTSCASSPSPSMIELFVTTSGLARFAASSTAIDSAYPARRSRTVFCSRSTVSMLCAYTSRPERATSATPSRPLLPLKSGVRHSMRIDGLRAFTRRTTRA